MSKVQYNKESFITATAVSKEATQFLDRASLSATSVRGVNVPADFSAKGELVSVLASVDSSCGESGDITTAFDSMSATVDELEKTGEINEAQWGDYLAFDDSLLIYVDGNPYPIDQYVIGVLDGEHEAMKAYTMYYHGQISYSQMIEFMKAFAIIARSYCLAQTIYSEFDEGKHKIDHCIENGSSKQCFNTRLYSNTGIYGDWAGVSSAAAQASIETSGMVYAYDGEAISTYFTSNTTAHLLSYATAGMNYKEILDTYYQSAVSRNWKAMADKSHGQAKLCYVDYSTEEILGEVPADELISSRAHINLNGNARLNVPYIVDSKDTGYAGPSDGLGNSYGPTSSNYIPPQQISGYSSGSQAATNVSNFGGSGEGVSATPMSNTNGSIASSYINANRTSGETIGHSFVKMHESEVTVEPGTETGESETITQPGTEIGESETITQPGTEIGGSESITQPEAEIGGSESITQPEAETGGNESNAEPIIEIDPTGNSDYFPIGDIAKRDPVEQIKDTLPQVNIDDSMHIDMHNTGENQVSYSIDNYNNDNYISLTNSFIQQGYLMDENGIWTNGQNTIELNYNEDLDNLVVSITNKTKK